MKNDGFFYNKLNKIRNYNYVFYFYMFVHNLFDNSIIDIINLRYECMSS